MSARASQLSDRCTRNLSYAITTEKRLTAISRATGIPRGRIVELALACIDICTDCNGEGTDEQGMLCPACRGSRIVPSACTND